MNDKDLVEQARTLIFKGADHLDVQRYLKTKLDSDKEMNKLLVILEGDFVKYQLAEQEKAKILNHIFIGIFLAILGGALLIYQILVGGYRHNIIYAIIIAGFWWSYRNFMIYKRPLEDFVPPENSSSRRRFKKRF